MTEQAAGISDTRAAIVGARSGLSPSLVRLLARIAIACQAVFIASWVVSGALQPHFSHLHSGISALGGRTAAHPWIVNTGFVLLGLSIVALAPCVLAALPRRTATGVAAAMFALAGVAMALVAAFPLDCDLAQSACKARFDAGLLSWRTDAHLWAGLVFELAFLATPFALARALWPRPVAAAALGSGLFGVAFTAATFAASNGAGVPDGLVERIGFVPLHLWVVVV